MRQLERPTAIPEIRALIEKRKREITVLEMALKVRHPANIRSLMVQQLKGTRNNLSSWEDYLRRIA